MKLLPIALFLPVIAAAQFYNISTIAGNGLAKFNGGGQAVNTVLIEPTAVAEDALGNVYISDDYFHQVFQVTPGGVITAYAGNGTAGFSGDGGQATSAQLFSPRGLAVDAGGNLYIADSINSRVRKVTPAGIISTVATEANVAWVAVDGSGNLYITGGEVVYKVDNAGKSTTIAGTGAAGFSGDGGPAIAATLYGPQGIRVDGAGNIYVADQDNNRIRKITPAGIISTFAGSASGGFAGDGGQANAAQLFLPEDISLDGKGNVFISDSLNGRVRMVNAQGVISTVAGGGVSFQNGPPAQAAIAPSGIAVEGNGNILMAEFNYRRVRRIAPLQSVTTIAGILATAAAGDNVAATSTALLDPFGVAVDASANVYIADRIDHRVRKVTPGGIITTVTGDGIPAFSGDGGPASKAQIGQPADLGFDPAGNLFIAAGVLRKITPEGVITTVAGTGTAGYSGDGGLATQASFLGITDAVGDSSGNLYITDRGNSRVRRVDASGIVSNFAGDGTANFAGDGGPAKQAELFQPFQVALDASNNLYIADWGNSRVRKVTPAGTITTVAGGGPQFGPPGDGGPATAATIGGNLYGVAVDAAGNLYITSNARIRKVDAVTGIISTIAGTGTAGFSGDGGLASLAAINGAQSIAVDTAGNVYFSDETNLRVRKLTPAQIVKEGVFNGGTFKAGGVSPGEIVTIYGGPGVSLGPAMPVVLQLDSSGRVANKLGGTQVMFDNVAAPLIYLSSGQINAIVPYEVAGEANTVLQVIVQGKPTNTVTLPVVSTSPGIFAIANPDNTANSPSNAVSSSDYVVLYATGEGVTAPAGVDGILNTAVYPKPLAKTSVKIGGQTAQVLYSGAAPGLVAGVFQVNVSIPAGVKGTVPIELTVGDASTPVGPTITIK
jgi:uncharacterized protein (TIGR03437 family)